MANCSFHFFRAWASRTANSVGMCLSLKDSRTLRVSARPMAAVYSRNGINATSSLSSTSPVHLGRITAFPGCASAWVASVSMRMILSRGRLRNDKS